MNVPFITNGVPVVPVSVTLVVDPTLSVAPSSTSRIPVEIVCPAFVPVSKYTVALPEG